LLRTDHPFQELLDGTLGLQTAMTMKIQNGSMYFQWYDCVHIKKGSKQKHQLSLST